MMRRVMMTGGAVLALLSTPAFAQVAQTRAEAQRNAALPATQALFDGYVKAGKMPGIVAAIGLQGSRLSSSRPDGSGSSRTPPPPHPTVCGASIR